MSKAGQIKEMLRNIVLGKQGWQYFNAVVVSTNGETSTVKIGSVTLTDVRNVAIADGNADNIKVCPSVGSSVLIADLSGGDMRDLAIVAYSRIDSISLFGGLQGGMVKSVELKAQLDKVSDRIDSIVDALRNSPTGMQDGGAAYKTAITTALASLDKEDFSNIENERIKQ